MYMLHMCILHTFPLLVGETGDYFVDLLNFTSHNTLWFKNKRKARTLNSTNYISVDYGRACMLLSL